MRCGRKKILAGFRSLSIHYFFPVKPSEIIYICSLNLITRADHGLDLLNQGIFSPSDLNVNPTPLSLSQLIRQPLLYQFREIYCLVTFIKKFLLTFQQMSLKRLLFGLLISNFILFLRFQYSLRFLLFFSHQI